MTTRRVSWRRTDEVEADEWSTLSVRDNGLSLVGTVVGAVDNLPLRVEYRVLADPTGVTTAVHVRQWHGFEQRALTLGQDAKGNWTRDGKTDRKLKGCTDVDLGISPSTNTLPIRRLRLAAGATARIKAAWVRFPELTVEKATQAYTRIDEFTWRYASGSFEAELVVDEDGLVASYAVWRRTGLAIGADDSEPLDAAR
ncbi:MAG TPA: putative glycolipid-binding domain-containing protein [Candidatus Limnocylindrales bacterium]|nr:putative glycolipid-binding domain-containing protein [Candidatus Limnocylindrales bacterium]